MTDTDHAVNDVAAKRLPRNAESLVNEATELNEWLNSSARIG